LSLHSFPLRGGQLLAAVAVAVEARTGIGFALVPEARHIVRHGGAVHRSGEEGRMRFSCAGSRVSGTGCCSKQKSEPRRDLLASGKQEGQDKRRRSRQPQRGQRRGKRGRRTGENGPDARLLLVTLVLARCAPLCLRRLSDSLACGHRLARLEPQQAGQQRRRRQRVHG
jgi:hypothetical protein